jgi:ABC-type thiamine transport system ATPase subunit
MLFVQYAQKGRRFGICKGKMLFVIGVDVDSAVMAIGGSGTGKSTFLNRFLRIKSRRRL